MTLEHFGYMNMPRFYKFIPLSFALLFTIFVYACYGLWASREKVEDGNSS